MLHKLEAHSDTRVRVLSAPAGYGKSSLLAHWYRQHSERGESAAWLTVDSNDNDPERLAAYIYYALAQAGIQIASEVYDQGRFYNSMSIGSMLGVIYQAIEAYAEPITLFLDELETLDSSTTAAVITALVHYLPENLSLVLATQEFNKLELARADAQGLVFRLAADELRFTLEEQAELLEEYVDAKHLKTVAEITEGWPVVVQMIRIAISKRRNIDQVLMEFNRHDGPVSAYLSERILQSLEPDQREFLMSISLLNQASLGYIQEILSITDAQSKIERLNGINALLTPLNDDANSYRLHPLFREFLYERLKRLMPDRVNVLRVKTANWLAEQGDLINAVKTYLAANETEKAISVYAEFGGLKLWLIEGLSRLRRLLDLYGPELIESNERLGLIRCLIDTKDGQVYRARCRCDDISNSKASQNNDDLAYECMLVSSLISNYEGYAFPEHFCLQLQAKIASLAHTEHETFAHHYTLLVLSYLQRGEFAKASHFADLSIPEFRQVNSIYGEMYIYFHQGGIAFSIGHSKQALALYNKGLSMAKKYFADDRGIGVVAYALISEIKYECNQLDTLPVAIRTLPRRLEDKEAWFDIYAAGFVTASKIEYHHYGIDAALRLVERAQQYCRGQKLRRLSNLLLCQKADLLVRASRFDEAQAIFDLPELDEAQYTLADKSQAGWRERDTFALSRARLYMLSGSAKRALQSIEVFHALAKTAGNIRSQLRYLIIRAIALDQLEEKSASYAALTQALAMAENTNYIRPFIDIGKAMKLLLQTYVAKMHSDPAGESISETGDADHINQARIILQALANTAGADTRDLNELSERERQVLLELSTGCANKIIAKRLSVSENTVRFHLKNIFAKLKVGSRAQAVKVAKDLDLLNQVDN